MDIYSQELLHFYKHQPHNKTLKRSDLEGRDGNLSCGDEISLEIKLDAEGKVEDIGYQSDGCIISTAAISMLTENMIGKNIKDILNLSTDDYLNSLGVDLTLSRQKCVLVGYNALKNAAKNYKKN